MKYYKNGHTYDFTVTIIDNLIHGKLVLNSRIEQLNRDYKEIFDSMYQAMFEVASGGGRKLYEYRLCYLLETYPELTKCYVYDNKQYRILNRFIPIEREEEEEIVETIISPIRCDCTIIDRGTARYENGSKFVKGAIYCKTAHNDLPTYDDGISLDLPTTPGLYMMGEIRYNPLEERNLYLIKIGKGCNLCSRIKDYKTTNPFPYCIDYIEVPNALLTSAESLLQNNLRNHAIAKCQHNREWYLVNEDTYYEMCRLGFHYFEED